MAQFDVHVGAQGRGYLLDCQTELLDSLGSRVVVPLLPKGEMVATPRLQPEFVVEGMQVVMATHLIFAIPKERIGKRVQSLASERYAILNAIDMLVTGV